MQISSRFLRIVTVAALICLAATCLGAQESSLIPEKVRKYRLAHENEIVGEFTTLLSIPNLASDMPNIERNAQAITKSLESRGVKVQLLREPGAPPIVYGRLSAPGVRPTVGIYAHYDGQPSPSNRSFTFTERGAFRERNASSALMVAAIAALSSPADRAKMRDSPS
jgi:hypothetical protein